MAAKPRTRHVAMAAVALIIAYVVWLIIHWSNRESFFIVDDLILVAASIPPLVFSLLAARSTRGRVRAGWSVLAVGLLSWNVGEALWTYAEITKQKSPGPSLADAFYLFWPVAACAALLLFWNRGPRQSYGRILLDGFIVAGSLFLVAWVLVMSDLFDSGTATTWEFALYSAYPVTDVILITVSAIVLSHAGTRLRTVLTLLTLGLMTMALNDFVYTYLSAELGAVVVHVLDIGWIAGLLLITVAAALGRDASLDHGPAREMPGWASIWLPYAPLLLAAAVLAYQPPDVDATPVVQGIGALLFVAVLGRQFLAVRESRRLVALVSDRALRDPLTGLRNRAAFDAGMELASRRPMPQGAVLGLILIDLNDFKFVNDTLGHLAGDELLCCAGERILACVRDGDVVARLGGDEFAVIVEGTTEDAHRVSQRIVECFADPFVIDGNELSIRGSVGLATVTADEPSISEDELLKRADVAMYSAKRASFGGVRTFTPEMTSDHALSAIRGGAATEAELLPDLRSGLERAEFALVYQPKYDLRTSAIVGVEALLRWQHPSRGVLAPDVFLPLVRRHGLMLAVTDFVVGRALDDVCRFRTSSIELPVAVNLFAPLFADLGLSDALTGALAKRGLDPSVLTVEITEELLVEDLERTRLVLKRLRQNGIRISVDDFGTGYSALTYLRVLRVDEVKLDREFIAPIADSPQAAALTRSMIAMGHELGLTVVAEGVENERIAAMLTDYGCDVAQGYFFSPPLTVEELLPLATARAVL